MKLGTASKMDFDWILLTCSDICETMKRFSIFYFNRLQVESHSLSF